jgi:hypothetical protein
MSVNEYWLSELLEIPLAFDLLGSDSLYKPQALERVPIEDAPHLDLSTVLLGSLGLATGGLSLPVFAGLVAYPAEIVRQLRQLNDRAQVALERLDELRQTTQEVLVKVSRIDIAVAEGNLRYALRYVLSGSVEAERVDLHFLSRVGDEIERFLATVDGLPGYGAAPGLKLSPETHDLLMVIDNLFNGARTSIFAWHNRAVGSDFSRAVPTNSSAFYEGYTQAIVAMVGMLRRIEASVDESEPNIVNEVMKRFIGGGRHPERSQKVIENQLWVQLRDAADEVQKGSVGVYQVLHQKLLPATPPYEDIPKMVRDYMDWWWMTSDAGLLMKSLMEIQLFQQGYDSVFAAAGIRLVDSAPDRLRVVTPPLALTT